VNELYQAQPNPANPSARIRYTIAQKGHVQLRIFDVSGRLVRTLVDQVQDVAATPYERVWDGMNDQGQKVGSGVFFYQIDAPGFSSSKKLVILK
jgi:flagellar hook assembly protein FlgD